MSGVDAEAECVPNKLQQKAKPGRKKKVQDAGAPATDPISTANGEAPQQPVAEKKAPAKRAKKPPPEPAPMYHPGLRPAPLAGGEAGPKLLSWNVAGIRAVLKKDAEAIRRLLSEEGASVLCLQETKLQASHVADVQAAMGLPPGWHASWACSQDKLGYSGVATLTAEAPLSVVVGLGASQHDAEGRIITTELEDMYVVNVYVPNAGDGLRRLDYRVGEWDTALSAHVVALQAHKPVVVTGDLNVAREEIDIHNPKGNLRSAGFTQEERDSFARHLLGTSTPPAGTDSGEGPQGGSVGASSAAAAGMVDTFRRQHPGVVGYTYWTHKFNCREKNKGWRLDYFLVSEALWPRVHDSYPLQHVKGSDHCPIGLALRRVAAQ